MIRKIATNHYVPSKWRKTANWVEERAFEKEDGSGRQTDVQTFRMWLITCHFSTDKMTEDPPKWPKNL